MMRRPVGKSLRTLSVLLCCIPAVGAPGCASQSAPAAMRDRDTGGQTASAQRAPTDLRTVPQMIVERTNQLRRDAGVGPLRSEAKLTETARQFAEYMARSGRLAHDADGNTPSGRATAQGYDYCIVLENIADASSTLPPTAKEIAAQFVEGWMDSPGHRQNMLDPDVTEIGVAVVQSAKTGAYVAVELFGRPRAMQIAFSVTNQTDQTIEYAVGSESFAVPPSSTRTHQICRPAELVLRGAAAQRGPFALRGGERLTFVRAASGTVDVQVSK